MEGNPKMQRVGGTGESGDRISYLPESLLLHILSFLDMVDVYKTSLLSRRWRYLWKNAHNMDFPHLICDSSGKEVRAQSFIDKLISVHGGSKVHKLRFVVDYLDSDSELVDRWVQFAVQGKVEMLDMDFIGGERECLTDVFGLNWDLESNLPLYGLPPFLCNCGSLKMLKVNFCDLRLPPSMCFSSLRTLVLRLVELTGGMIEDLISNCPLLENLTLDDCNRGIRSELNITVSSSNLQHLKILESLVHVTGGNFMLDAPNLLSLEFSFSLPRESYHVKDLTSLVTASFNLTDIHSIWEGDGNHNMVGRGLLDLLGNLRHAKDLILCSYCIQIISFRVLGHMQSLDAPFFNAKHLELRIGLMACELPGIVCVLSQIHNLESLILTIDSWDESEIYYYNEYHFTEKKYRKLLKYSSCSLLQHLKTVEICGFTESSNVLPWGSQSIGIKEVLKQLGDEFELVKFLLKNSKVLEKIVLKNKGKYGGFGRWAERSDLIRRFTEKLSSYPKGSPNAEIILSLR